MQAVRGAENKGVGEMGKYGLMALCLSLVLLAAGCKHHAPQPEAPIRVVTICSGCGSEWVSLGPGEREPITKCPNCPMSMEEFEALKEQVRKRLEDERKEKE